MAEEDVKEQEPEEEEQEDEEEQGEEGQEEEQSGGRRQSPPYDEQFYAEAIAAAQNPLEEAILREKAIRAYYKDRKRHWKMEAEQAQDTGDADAYAEAILQFDNLERRLKEDLAEIRQRIRDLRERQELKEELAELSEEEKQHEEKEREHKERKEDIPPPAKPKPCVDDTSCADMADDEEDLEAWDASHSRPPQSNNLRYMACHCGRIDRVHSFADHPNFFTAAAQQFRKPKRRCSDFLSGILDDDTATDYEKDQSNKGDGKRSSKRTKVSHHPSSVQIDKKTNEESRPAYVMHRKCGHCQRILPPERFDEVCYDYHPGKYLDNIRTVPSSNVPFVFASPSIQTLWPVWSCCHRSGRSACGCRVVFHDL